MNRTQRLAVVNTPQRQTQTHALVWSSDAKFSKFFAPFFSANYLVILMITAAHIGAAALIIGNTKLCVPKPIVKVQHINIIPAAPAPLAVESPPTPAPEHRPEPVAEPKTKPEPPTPSKPVAMTTAVEQTPAPVNSENITSTPTATEVAFPNNEPENSVSGETRSAREEAGMGSNPAPIYPPVSRKLREQGVSLLSVHILADGRVAEVRLARSSGYPRLDDSAISAVKQWRYQPALENGVAVDSWYQQPVEFTLRK